MRGYLNVVKALVNVVLFASCGILEKSSRHGFESGYFYLTSDKNSKEKVYAVITQEKLVIFPVLGKQLVSQSPTTILLLPADTACLFPIVFHRKSLDIDITSVLFKYRPARIQLPAQMTTEFNAALYAGWRHDFYHIQNKMTPLGNCESKIINRGFDVGLFAGPTTALMGPFSTRNYLINDYTTMAFQFGLAAFIESNVASFGLATGFDYLFNKDRSSWVYLHQPWVGFIVGVALN